MNKTLLLATAAVVALSAGGASAVPVASFWGKSSPFHIPENAQVLYNQNSNFTGEAIDSQNFTSSMFSTYDDQGADDFVVPKGVTWTITEVDVAGQYFNGAGPATSENVVFYSNYKVFDRPGKVLKKFKNLKGGGLGTSAASFAIAPPDGGVTLASGHYWVSVIANLDFNKGGEWGWDVSSVQHGDLAMWRNPCPQECGLCQNWDTIQDCTGVSAPDFMFDLQGTSKRE